MLIEHEIHSPLPENDIRKACQAPPPGQSRLGGAAPETMCLNTNDVDVDVLPNQQQNPRYLLIAGANDFNGCISRGAKPPPLAEYKDDSTDHR